MVDARANDISSLVFLFFQFARSVDEEGKESDRKTHSGQTRIKGSSLTGTRETLRVVFEPPIPRRNSRRLKERIMRYANNINSLTSRTSRLKGGGRSQRQQSVAMVTAANQQVRVAVFCDALFNVELSRQIAEQTLQGFTNRYCDVLAELEPKFHEEAKDQNEARTHLQYMERFRGFVGALNELVEKHPKSTQFTNPQTVAGSVSIRSRGGSRFEDDEKGMIPQPQPRTTDHNRPNETAKD